MRTGMCICAVAVEGGAGRARASQDQSPPENNELRCSEVSEQSKYSNKTVIILRVVNNALCYHYKQYPSSPPIFLIGFRHLCMCVCVCLCVCVSVCLCVCVYAICKKDEMSFLFNLVVAPLLLNFQEYITYAILCYIPTHHYHIIIYIKLKSCPSVCPHSFDVPHCNLMCSIMCPV